METSKIETAKSFIGDNIKYLDSTSPLIKIELIILYFNINIDYIKQIDHPFKNIILNNIITNKFTISDESLLVGEHFILDLKDLYNLVDLIEIKRLDNQVIPSNNMDLKVYRIKRKKNSNILKLESRVLQSLTIDEQREYFERSLSIDHTKSYRSQTEYNFSNDISTSIRALLNHKQPEINNRELIMSLISLYPLLYMKDQEDLPYSELPMPKYEICLRKSTYTDPKINSLEEYIQKYYNMAHNIIISSNNYGYDYEDGVEYLEYNPSGKEVTLDQIITQNRLNRLNMAMQKKSIELFHAKYEDSTYTENYLDNIIKCIRYNGVELIKNTTEPIVILYYIEDNEVKFYSKLHLKTLKKLIPNTTILGVLEEQLILKK